MMGKTNQTASSHHFSCFGHLKLKLIMHSRRTATHPTLDIPKLSARPDPLAER